MSYFWTCPYCEANLDPGEHCDCQEQEDANRRYHRHNKQFIKNLEDITNGEHDN
jgi:hypothetical protein